MKIMTLLLFLLTPQSWATSCALTCAFQSFFGTANENKVVGYFDTVMDCENRTLIPTARELGNGRPLDLLLRQSIVRFHWNDHALEDVAIYSIADGVSRRLIEYSLGEAILLKRWQSGRKCTISLVDRDGKNLETDFYDIPREQRGFIAELHRFMRRHEPKCSGPGYMNTTLVERIIREWNPRAE